MEPVPWSLVFYLQDLWCNKVLKLKGILESVHSLISHFQMRRQQCSQRRLFGQSSADTRRTCAPGLHVSHTLSVGTIFSHTLLLSCACVTTVWGCLNPVVKFHRTNIFSLLRGIHNKVILFVVLALHITLLTYFTKSSGWSFQILGT